MTATQWDLSRIYQRKIERKLAGFALIHPLQALRAFRKVENLMLDDIAIGWLRYLIRHERDLIALDNERRVHLCYQLALGWQDGAHLTKLIGGMNQSYRCYEPVKIDKGELVWSQYSIEFIGEDLADRIEEQHIFRSGLKDLTWFVDGYLDGNYAR